MDHQTTCSVAVFSSHPDRLGRILPRFNTLEDAAHSRWDRVCEAISTLRLTGIPDRPKLLNQPLCREAPAFMAEATGQEPQ